MSKLTPSKYQADIFNFVKNGTGNAVINAVAGSGKTTTIIASLKYIPLNVKVIFLAFNKSIVEDIKTRVPTNVVVKTFHSLGCSSIYKVYKNLSTLDNNKVYNIINHLSTRWSLVDNKEVDPEYKFKIKTIVDLARVTLCVDEAEMKIVCDKHQIEYTDKDIERCFRIIEDANNDISVFDFNDMIYWPARFDHFCLEKYDMIYIDECQDLNKTQHKLIEKISHTNTRIIAVGDRNQAIYGFTGADSESFDNLTKMPNTTLLPLSVSYRCGTEIIKMAKTIVGHIEAFEFAKTGVFDHSASVTEVVEGDMVLCRNTAPLVKLCLEFLHQGKKAYVKGADIGEELVRLVVRSGKKTNAELVMWLEYELKKISNQLKKRFTSYEDKQVAEHNSYVLFAEKQTLLTTIITSEGFLYTKDLIVKIRQIFMDVYSSGVCLSTVHKAKGLECDRVFILDKEKTMPSRYAKLPWQRLQEKNLEYVAYTRAKDYLGFIIDWTFFPDKK